MFYFTQKGEGCPTGKVFKQLLCAVVCEKVKVPQKCFVCLFVCTGFFCVCMCNARVFTYIGVCMCLHLMCMCVYALLGIHMQTLCAYMQVSENHNKLQ